VEDEKGGGVGESSSAPREGDHLGLRRWPGEGERKGEVPFHDYESLVIHINQNFRREKGREGGGEGEELTGRERESSATYL